MTPTITQSDRKAAARLAALAELRPMLLSGSHDDHPYIQIVAAHREAGELAGVREERARVVGWLWDHCFGDDDLNRASVILGDRIQRGEHITDPAEVLARHGATPDPLTTWDCPIKHEGCVKNCGSYGCGN